MSLRNINAGQTGAEVREILNTTIGEVTKVTGDIVNVNNEITKVSKDVNDVSGEVSQISQDLKEVSPLTNTEIEEIFNH